MKAKKNLNMKIKKIMRNYLKGNKNVYFRKRKKD
jgi:hypothetical protein